MPADAPAPSRLATAAIGQAQVIYAEDVAQLCFPWGRIQMLIDPQVAGSRAFSFGIVESAPGGSHELHQHAQEEEIIFVIEGEAELHLAGQAPLPLRPGAAIYLPPGILHATVNVGTTLLRVAIVYAPAGPERALASLPGCSILPAGACASAGSGAERPSTGHQPHRSH